MSDIKPFETEYIEKLALLRFTRPEIKNPLSINTLELLFQTFAKIEKNLSIETIVFTGSGDTFAAGANLKEVAALNNKTSFDFGLLGQRLMQKIYNSKKRTIAAIDGFCMGGALDLALSCNYRYATERSYFAHPGAKLGIITGWSGTQILPILIGKKKSLELLLTASKINSREAFQIGLIDGIIDDPLAKILDSFSK